MLLLWCFCVVWLWLFLLFDLLVLLVGFLLDLSLRFYSLYIRFMLFWVWVSSLMLFIIHIISVLGWIVWVSLGSC